MKTKQKNLQNQPHSSRQRSKYFGVEKEVFCMVLFLGAKMHGAFKQHLLRLGVDALWEAASGTEAGAGSRAAPGASSLPLGAGEIKARSSNSRTDPVRLRAGAGRRWEGPGGGRSQAGPGAVRDGGSGRGARGRESPAVRPADFIGQPLGQPSPRPPSCCRPAASSGCRRLGLPCALGRNLGAGEGLGGVGVASAMLGTVTLAGKAVWHPGGFAARARQPPGTEPGFLKPRSPRVPTRDFPAGR